MLTKPQACEHLGTPLLPHWVSGLQREGAWLGWEERVTGYLGEGLSLFLCLLPYPRSLVAKSCGNHWCEAIGTPESILGTPSQFCSLPGENA